MTTTTMKHWEPFPCDSSESDTFMEIYDRLSQFLGIWKFFLILKRYYKLTPPKIQSLY